MDNTLLKLIKELMLLRNALILIILSFLLVNCISGNDIANTESRAQKINWIYQVDSLLMPFWTMEEALGSPVGNFPNYRLNNGQILKSKNLTRQCLNA